MVMGASCPLCGAEDPSELGSLGWRVHYRCRACGADFSERLERPVELTSAERALVADAAEATEYFTDDELES